MRSNSKLKDRWVLVTGAAAGIGLHTAICYGKAGANLILTDIDELGLDTATKHIEEIGVQCLTMAFDVSNPESVQACSDVVHAKNLIP